MTVTGATTEDLIATIWFGLGFRPSESLVLAGLEGPRDRIGVMLRTDLPEPRADRRLLAALASSALEPILDSPAHSVLALVASGRALAEPVPPIAAVLHDSARDEGLCLLDVIGVTQTAYRSLTCRDARCCPGGGHPIAAVMSSRAAAGHVLTGATVADSLEDLIADVHPEIPPTAEPGDGEPGDGEPGDGEAGDGEAGDGEAGEAGKPRTRLVEGRLELTPEERMRWWQRWTAAVETAQTATPSAGRPLGGLSAALHDPYLRDAVLMQVLGASPRHVAMLLDGAAVAAPGSPAGAPEVPAPPGGPSEADLGRLLGRAPDEARMAPGLTVLAGAARVAGPGARAPGLAVLALIAWYQGRAARARLLAERARADDPVMSLTELVESLLAGRVSPPWVRMGRYRA